jgi:hypothetical protein
VSSVELLYVIHPKNQRSLFEKGEFSLASEAGLSKSELTIVKVKARAENKGE